jgi:hypothetical protein
MAHVPMIVPMIPEYPINEHRRRASKSPELSIPRPTVRQRTGEAGPTTVVNRSRSLPRSRNTSERLHNFPLTGNQSLAQCHNDRHYDGSGRSSNALAHPDVPDDGYFWQIAHKILVDWDICNTLSSFDSANLNKLGIFLDSFPEHPIFKFCPSLLVLSSDNRKDLGYLLRSPKAMDFVINYHQANLHTSSSILQAQGTLILLFIFEYY